MHIPLVDAFASLVRNVRSSSRIRLDHTITIATAAHGNAQATHTLLASLFRSVKGDYELILVDDSSPDQGATLQTFKDAAALHHNTRIFAFSENQEYSGSLRTILSHASGDYIFFLSNDMIVSSEYFRLLLSVARKEPTAGILRGSSNFVDNGLASHNLAPSRPIDTLKDVQAEARDVAERFGEGHQPDPYLTGDAFLTTRTLIDAIGVFDPLFFGYFADHDFGLRSKIAGFSNLLVPGAYVYHCRDANFEVLPDAERRIKRETRWARVHANWEHFKDKYDLPKEQPYTGINHIPWAELEKAEFAPSKHYRAPGDYTANLIDPAEG